MIYGHIHPCSQGFPELSCALQKLFRLEATITESTIPAVLTFDTKHSSEVSIASQ